MRLAGYKICSLLHFTRKVSLHSLPCYRNMIINCFNEEVKASNKNCKVNGSAVCFLYSIFFLCYFYSGSLHCFNRSLYCFLREKVDGSMALIRASCWVASKTLGVEWCGKMLPQTTSQTGSSRPII